MTPSQLAKSGTEAGHQMAVMCWARVAETHGFAVAWLFDEIGRKAFAFDPIKPIPKLKWLHAIANGGSRGDSAESRAIRGGQLKAQGVKAGVSDLMLPVSVWIASLADSQVMQIEYCGLYIEMKKPGRLNKLTEEQKEFAEFVESERYAFIACDNWQEACKAIERYLSDEPFYL